MFVCVYASIYGCMCAWILRMRGKNLCVYMLAEMHWPGGNWPAESDTNPITSGFSYTNFCKYLLLSPHILP